MDPKSKKELAKQGSSVVQAVKWIGGAIFGDADDVLDDMAERGDQAQGARPSKRVPPRAADPALKPKPRRAPPPDVIDVEGFVEDEDDE